MNLAYAIALASKAFVNKKDKGGQPYILHCLHVMNEMPADDEELRMIAVLHDVVEDTSWTLDDLREANYPERVVLGIAALTHNDGDDYFDKYIKGISFNADATKVKLADLEHNSQIMRMKGLSKKDFDRLEKYHRAYAYLRKV